MARVSIGQAAANAIAAWLRKTLASDIVVNARWPEPSVELPAKAVTVIRHGKPDRVDVSCLSLAARTNLTDTTTRATFQYGGLTQPIQIDVWATNDFDRDDIVAQLDDALVAGIDQTLGLSGDPIRDGILVPFLEEDGFTGNVDFTSDAADVSDDPQSVARGEFRATYMGEAQFAYVASYVVPRGRNLTLKQKVHEGAVAPPGMLNDTITVAPNPDPPPAFKITHGTS